MEVGTILEWLVKPGDAVKRGDIIAVVDTEKATIEVEVFETGVIQKIVVPVGEKVPIGTLLALIRTDGEVVAPAAAKPAPVAAPPKVTPTPPPTSTSAPCRREASASADTAGRAMPHARISARDAHGHRAESGPLRREGDGTARRHHKGRRRKGGQGAQRLPSHRLLRRPSRVRPRRRPRKRECAPASKGRPLLRRNVAQRCAE